jgi:DNA repair exonuclease SbcCD ATPase subunit
MDKDTFETKLREVRRQKSQVEEELESVSERWRNERRRLNSEIDRLEAALADVKDSRKKVTSGKPAAGVDPVEVAKMQAAADERVKKAEKTFDSERAKLRDEISRLQRAVADMIERSNNPMRSTEPIKEQFQAQLEEAFKAKQLIEEELYRSWLSWEEEKLKMTGEMF